MRCVYTFHAAFESMPDEKISKQEVEDTIKKSELTEKIAIDKYKFRYRDLEVVCVKKQDYWLVVTCYRLNR